MQSKVNFINKQPPQALPIRRNQRNNDPAADTAVFDRLNLNESSNSVRPEEVQVLPRPEQEQIEASDPLGLLTARENIEIAVEQLNQISAILDERYSFEVVEDIDQLVVRVSDLEGEIIHQMPPERAVNLTKNINQLIGIFQIGRAHV